MRRKRTAGAVLSLADRKSQSLQDQEFEERLRVAERLVRALREAGFSCEQPDGGHMRASEREN